jgi:pimeloyl-ACP methyl ester carboxylesterase
MSASSPRPPTPEGPGAASSSHDARQGLSRRAFIGGAAAAAGASLASGWMPPAAASTRTPTPKGPGSVSGAPHLPPGFTKTFTSRYVDIGELRLHAVTGGHGRPLLLVHGWPQTWYAWRLLMPELARDFQVVAVDQRGIGLSDKPKDGYDTGTLANDLVALMEVLGHQRFALVGVDTGMNIAYALAADHQDRVDRLVAGEAPRPGVGPPVPLLVPAPVNQRIWHIAFNRTAKVNEQLVKGREAIYFGNEFAVAAAKPLPEYAVRYYVRIPRSDRDALRGSFGFYRALDTTPAARPQRPRTRGRPGARRHRPGSAVRQAHPSGRRDHLRPGRVAGEPGRGPATDDAQGRRRLARPGRNDPRGEERRQRECGGARHLRRRKGEAAPHAGRVSASPSCGDDPFLARIGPDPGPIHLAHPLKDKRFVKPSWSLRWRTVFEGLHMPLLGGATGWLNSEPLGPAELRGHVVLVDLWTLTSVARYLADRAHRRTRGCFRLLGGDVGRAQRESGISRGSRPPRPQDRRPGSRPEPSTGATCRRDDQSSWCHQVKARQVL